MTSEESSESISKAAEIARKEEERLMKTINRPGSFQQRMKMAEQKRKELEARQGSEASSQSPTHCSADAFGTPRFLSPVPAQAASNSQRATTAPPSSSQQEEQPSAAVEANVLPETDESSLQAERGAGSEAANDADLPQLSSTEGGVSSQVTTEVQGAGEQAVASEEVFDTQFFESLTEEEYESMYKERELQLVTAFLDLEEPKVTAHNSLFLEQPGSAFMLSFINPVSEIFDILLHFLTRTELHTNPPECVHPAQSTEVGYDVTAAPPG